MNKDVEKHIKDGYVWSKLPERVKMACGNSEEEYNRSLVEYAIRNQVRYRGSTVRYVIKNERLYYERLLQYSKKNLMLYPYHLQERMIGLRVTAFSYYVSMMEEIMSEERSYDSLPNFTAADCLRLLGIGRNQYIELMNNSRSSRKFSFRRKPQVREFLPKNPIPTNIEPWWMVYVGYITEDDIKLCSPEMKSSIDGLIDAGPTTACLLDREVLGRLYTRGLVFVDVPVKDDTKVTVPPLEGFVMNRVLGDYFETLLYKIFVSIDEQTTMSELSAVLDITPELVRNAVSVFLRLGFARLKESFDVNGDPKVHRSWKETKLRHTSNGSGTILHLGPSLLDLDFSEEMSKEAESVPGIPDSYFCDLGESVSEGGEDISMDSVKVEKDDTLSLTSHSSSSSLPTSCCPGKRVAFLFDSSLTAFLMMGNLSPGLKNHAVTLFEVGKLTDEAVNNFVAELYKVRNVEEDDGEARRYFDHAVNLRSTIEFLRHNKHLTPIFCGDPAADDSVKSDETPAAENLGIGLDLIRCESLSGLDHKTVARLINKNYHVVLSMAPLNDDVVTNLTHELRPNSETAEKKDDMTSVTALWFGPSCATINSVWFKLFLYHITGYGPPSLLLARGTKFCRLPDVFENYDELLITSIGHDPCIVATSNVVLMLNEALTHSPVLVQGYCVKERRTEKVYIPFPFANPNVDDSRSGNELNIDDGGMGEAQAHSTLEITDNLNSGKSNPDIPPSVELPKIVQSDQKLATKRQILQKLLENVVVKKVQSEINLEHTCGFVTLLRATRSVSEVEANVPSGGEGAGDVGNVHMTDKSHDEDADWQLLNVNFGIPLFDEALNRDVCEKLVSCGLCDPANSSALREANIKLSRQIEAFISHYQESSEEFDQFQANENVPYPRQSLFFRDGFLSVWEGM